jgi:imidazolonepropionase-like amidohydrolase
MRGEHSLRRFSSLLLLSAGMGLVSARAQAPQETVIAIRDVTVISGTGAPVLKGATVLIRGRRIEVVGPAKGVPIPAGAQVIDGSGKYLIPGLIDTHVHIAGAVGKPALDRALALELAHGVTGVRDASGIGRERELVALRSHSDSGEVLAPRLYVSGSGTPQKVPRYQATGLVDLIQKLAVVGVDGIKLRNLSGAQADTVISAARATGLPSFGHTYGGAGDYTLRAIDAGAAGAMHVLGIGPAAQLAPRELLAKGWQRGWLELYLHWTDASAAEEERLLRRMVESHTWLEPTFTTDAFVLHDEWYRGRAESRFLFASYDSMRMGFPTYTGNDLVLAREAFQRMQRFVRRFQEAGGLVLAGTDMLPWPGAGLHEELRLLVLAGLTPMQALQAATRNAARALGWEGKTGTIVAGLDADLALLDADPLQDITNSTRIWKVIRAGRVIDRATLDSMSK